ncbi:MAG: translesion error-prone DNA polymerase V autoproteolytic subunit [Planctomycetaceae bacterium]|nr:translesion error-prone DNA polymerase V autoproteolytic subunit [Planctomycetaceae bacterium]
MARGGRRKGAGRPKGTGKFGEPTKAIRLPISMIDRIMQFIAQKGLVMPIYTTQMQAVFPTPAEDVPPETFDLIEHLVPNPAATFLVRVQGESMSGASINPGDILLVDKSVDAIHGNIVLTVVDGEFTVRRLLRRGDKIELAAENPNYPPIAVNDESELNIWGVVKQVIHQV